MKIGKVERQTRKEDKWLARKFHRRKRQPEFQALDRERELAAKEWKGKRRPE
jgi:hypothetical protein